QTIGCRIIAATVNQQPVTAKRGPGESGPIVRVARDRLLQQTKRFRELSCRRPDHRMSAQVEIVGSEVVRRTTAGTGGFRLLQGGLDDASDARSDLVLKVEDIFEPAVEMIGPQMRPGARVYQLTGDAHPITALAHRAFEHITNTQLAADPLHVDVLAL